MSVSYSFIQWNAHKGMYDIFLLIGILTFIFGFAGVHTAVHGEAALNPEVLVVRGLAVCAFVMLHVILMIGPLARLDSRFAPLLYNRRHFGVAMFAVAFTHGLLATLYYGGFGSGDPATAVFAGYTSGPLVTAPFEVFGLAALVILFVMASTSHDFFLKHLSPRVWKSLHMLVYAAYVLVVVHVSLGAFVTREGFAGPAAVLLGAVALSGLHLAAGLRQRRLDSERASVEGDGWLHACDVGDLEEGRPRAVVTPGGVRYAVVRHAGAVAAFAATCPHQGGPLDEGEVIDGCLTCPWHGYQFRISDGCSPPPYNDRIERHDTKLDGSRVLVRLTHTPPGTDAETVTLSDGRPAGDTADG